MLQRGVSIQQVRIGVGCDFVLQICQFFFCSDQTGERSEGFIQNRCALVEIRNLFEGSSCKAASAADGAFAGFLRVGEYLEECGLSGTIRPDETDLLTGIDLKGDVSENGLSAEESRNAV